MPARDGDGDGTGGRRQGTPGAAGIWVGGLSDKDYCKGGSRVLRPSPPIAPPGELTGELTGGPRVQQGKGPDKPLGTAAETLPHRASPSGPSRLMGQEVGRGGHTNTSYRK